MSGVEVIFGAVSGGAGLVSLAIQLWESAAKLKTLFNAANNAPQTVSALIFSLETLALELKELEQGQQPGPGSLLARCITACRSRTSEIQQLVSKMERCMAKHEGLRGRVYTALKDRDVKELLDDLERTKSSLVLAYMTCLGAELTRRDQAHRELMYDLQRTISAGNTTTTRQLALLLKSPTSTRSQMSPLAAGNSIALAASDSPQKSKSYMEGFKIGQRIASERPRRRQQKRISFRLPLWLCSRICDLTIGHDHCGWSIALRTWNNIPGDSLIFWYCETGDIGGVQKLIGSGQASLLDVSYDRFDQTLIEVSVQDHACVWPNNS